MSKAVVELVIAAFLLGGWLNSYAADMTDSSSAQVDVVEQILKAHRNARSYKEWKSSPWQAEHVIEEWQVKPPPKEVLEKFCQDAQRLADHQLSLIFEILESSWASKNLACNKTLQIKMRNLFAHDSFALLNSNRRATGPNIYPKLGPSTEFWLDEDKADVVIGAHLAPKQIALTFDDGPHPYTTPLILNHLRQQETTAHFFVVGNRLAANRDILVQTQQEGHSIGNHSQSHKDLSRLNLAEAKKEVSQAMANMLLYLPSMSATFRFPYGAGHRSLRREIYDAGIYEFFWRIDTEDWRVTDPAQLLNKVKSLSIAYNRGVILFHDTLPQTEAILPAYLEWLQEMKFEPLVYRTNKRLTKTDLDKFTGGPR